MTTPTISRTSRAWLLDFGYHLQAAVGLHEMRQVLIAPELFDVPCTPTYCSEVVLFQQLILPIFDIPRLLIGRQVTTSRHVVGIAVYQEDPNKPLHYGGLHLITTPTSIYVNDDQVCELSSQQQYWEPFAISCFSYQGEAIPIINLSYLFSAQFNRLQQEKFNI